MNPLHYAKKTQDAVRALVLSKRRRHREYFTHDQLRAHQQAQLRKIVDYAREHSPFYRDHLRSLPAQWTLQSLPTVTKEALMGDFDRAVTDRRLKLDQLRDFVRDLSSETYFKGEFRVASSAGSSGFPGLFVFNRREWADNLATVMRNSSFMGVSPTLPRVKGAIITAAKPIHSSHLWVEALNVGVYNNIRLDAESPMATIVDRLNAFQPQCLIGFASLIAILAEEQTAGRLRIAPRVIATAAEMCTVEAAEAIETAFAVRPHNNYGLSDLGMAACTCSERKGLHLYEDYYLFEVVDEHHQPVPLGQPGSKLLVTGLYNLTQPLIRYEIPDILTISPTPCPCGRGLALVETIGGRSDDVITLDRPDGSRQGIHPIHFCRVLSGIPGMTGTQYRVRYETDGLHVTLLRDAQHADDDRRALVRSALTDKLTSLDFRSPAIHVQLVDRLERDPSTMGKVKLVQSNVR